ncbi:DUF805 domain-containing protein [Acetobacter orientalis]|uniref:DUF805 domain-containing protein n=1 Tax=Acetobacter orientalis TaxID=146474 RepID=UPI0020A3B410|nr:DUF805 domain-containing protein [Acetobacter orientalis]MCP1220363.1 DUF805 domain-containing protein [Acetobacter orientalis]
MQPKNGFDWFMVALKRYAEFKGRSSRSEFWYFQSFVIGLSVLSRIIDNALGTTILNPIISLATFIPCISVGVRRLHDIDRSGWWYLLPIVNLIFFCQKSDASTNRFGPPNFSSVDTARPTTSAETSMDNLARIERLADLRSKGVLSEEEFQAQKNALL